MFFLFHHFADTVSVSVIALRNIFKRLQTETAACEIRVCFCFAAARSFSFALVLHSFSVCTSILLPLLRKFSDMRTDLFEIVSCSLQEPNPDPSSCVFTVQQTLSKLCFSDIDLLHHGIGTLLFGLNVCSAGSAVQTILSAPVPFPHYRMRSVSVSLPVSVAASSCRLPYLCKLFITGMFFFLVGSFCLLLFLLFPRNGIQTALQMFICHLCRMDLLCQISGSGFRVFPSSQTYC